MENKHKKQLPLIPNKRYFAIGEVSTLCDLKPHVLRYWEQEFSQLKPTTRRGNRRYYQQAEILLIRKIRELLYFDGFTIQGAKGKLSDRQFVKDTTSKEAIEKAQAELPLDDSVVSQSSMDLNNFKAQLSDILKVLK
ncbi:MerR family transcriptional regulator [Methylophilaceae bacterium]|nr:MerR family transcriptional regulator [Nitrosomonadales bacterium]MCH9781161.1 MerR family transcriptional regulator [Betaproteobacteria bacterium]MDA7751511.1 MerR family transcriptional regulator [Methylophilaceae bacterium]MBT5411404.1 MerR family transcriptional regulator [Nitrosomonadales bacterium]MBT6141425.1 MerR family transcriptional regulator [Nitrosomonadales bacterium]